MTLDTCLSFTTFRINCRVFLCTSSISFCWFLVTMSSLVTFSLGLFLKSQHLLGRIGVCNEWDQTNSKQMGCSKNAVEAVRFARVFCSHLFQNFHLDGIPLVGDQKKSSDTIFYTSHSVLFCSFKIVVIHPCKQYPYYCNLLFCFPPPVHSPMPASIALP